VVNTGTPVFVISEARSLVHRESIGKVFVYEPPFGWSGEWPGWKWHDHQRGREPFTSWQQVRDWFYGIPHPTDPERVVAILFGVHRSISASPSHPHAPDS